MIIKNNLVNETNSLIKLCKFMVISIMIIFMFTHSTEVFAEDSQINETPVFALNEEIQLEFDSTINSETADDFIEVETEELVIGEVTMLDEQEVLEIDLLQNSLESDEVQVVEADIMAPIIDATKEGYIASENKFYVADATITNRWVKDHTGNQYYANANGLIEKKIVNNQFIEHNVLQKDRHININGSSYYFDANGLLVKNATVNSTKLGAWFVADSDGVLTYEVTPWGHYVNNVRQYDSLAQINNLEFYYEPKQWGGALARNKWSYSPSQTAWYYSNSTSKVERKVTPSELVIDGKIQKDKHISINGYVSYYYDTNGKQIRNQTVYASSMKAWFVSDNLGRLINEVTPWGHYVNAVRQYDSLAKVNNLEFYFEPKQWGGRLSHNKWSYSPSQSSWYYSNGVAQVERKVMPTTYTVNGEAQKDKHISINGMVSYYYDITGKQARNQTSHSTSMNAWFISDNQGRLIYEVTPWGHYVNGKQQFDVVAKINNMEFYFEPKQYRGMMARNKWSYNVSGAKWHRSATNGVIEESFGKQGYWIKGVQQYDVVLSHFGHQYFFKRKVEGGKMAINDWSRSDKDKTWYQSNVYGYLTHNQNYELPVQLLLHHVQKGEGLQSIANKFGVTVDNLKKWNRLASNYVAVGQELLVADPIEISALLRTNILNVANKTDKISDSHHDVPYLSQNDPRWKNSAYGNDVSRSIWENGCGIVSLAMVDSYFKGTITDPTDVAQWAGLRHYVWGAGTAWSVFDDFARSYGYKVTAHYGNFDSAMKAISNGAIGVMSVNRGYFTGGGHIMVVRGYQDGKVYINDPNDSDLRNNTLRGHTESLVRAERANFWTFTKR